MFELGTAPGGVRSLLLVLHPQPTPVPTANPKSCVDFANNGIVDDGVFRVDLDEDGIADTYVYCDFDGDYAWTLIESGIKNNIDVDVIGAGNGLARGFNADVTAYESLGSSVTDFSSSAARDLYRMSKSNMQLLWNQSTYLRATCNLPVSARPTRDFMVAYTSDFSYLLSSDVNGYCTDAIMTNIAGYSCSGSVAVWSSSAYWHPHIDYGVPGQVANCDCDPWSDYYTNSEDAFGHYNRESTDHACSASSTSTTEWWFGACVESGSCTSYI